MNPRKEGKKNIIDIAVQSDVGPAHPKANLPDVGVKNYMRNPVVLWDHGRDVTIGRVPIARSTKLTKSRDGLFTAEFEFVDGDERAQRIKNGWDKGFIQAASVAIKNKAKGSGYPPDLQITEWSLTGVPVDEEALRRSHGEMIKDFLSGEETVNNLQEVLEMDKEELKKLISEAISDSTTQRSEGDELDTEKLATGLADKLGESIERSVTAAVEKLDKEKSEEIKRAEEAEKKKEELENDLKNKVAERAELVSSARTHNLIPEDKIKEIPDMSNKDILLLALGTERSEELKDKPEEYLQAMFDHEVATRSEAASHGYSKPLSKDPGKGGAQKNGGINNIIDLKKRVKGGIR